MDKTIEERIDWLEKEYERLYHTDELLAIYIPQLAEILIRYWSVSGKHQEAVLNDIRSMRDLTKLINQELKEHFKSHYLDKKEILEKRSLKKKGTYNKYL